MIVENPESEPEVVDEPESKLEVLAELVSPQEKISSRPTEVEELPVETPINLPAEPTMKLVPSLTAMMTSLSLRSHNE